MAVQVGKNLTEMRLEPPPAAALSSNTALFFLGLHASKSPCPQSSTARIRESSPIHHLSLLSSGWGLPGLLEQQISKSIYPGWGWHMPWERTDSSGADNSVLPLTCLIFPSDHPICMPFQDESLLLLSPLLDFIFLPSLHR